MKPLLPLSLKEAANMTGITKRQIVSLAGYGKLPVHFQYCGYVALFKSFTDQDGDAYVYQNPASDSVPVLGIFRSVTPPVLQQNLRIVSIRPAAIECVEVYSGSPPGVPEGFALARVTGPSIPVDDMLRFLEEEPRADAPRLDESPIGIENWLFLPEDLDRFLGAPAAAPPAPIAPEVADDAAPRDDATPTPVQSAVTASEEPAPAAALRTTSAPEVEVLRKRSALIEEFAGVWPTIEGDLRDGSRNGLSAVANASHGYWKVGPALNWAAERGKIQREKAEAFVRADGESEIAAIVRVMLAQGK
ncbi:MAG: hypothetical protein V5B38_11770 [Candidatus Accumulibacter propinquus]|jgi:hypothetical protein